MTTAKATTAHPIPASSAAVLRRQFYRWAFFGGVVILLVTGATNPTAKLPEPQSRAGRILIADASELKTTAVTAHLDTPVQAGQNLLWCGTMQLAWNEACEVVGSDLGFQAPHPLVAALNQRQFTKAELDSASYVAMAGLVGADIYEQIQKSVRRKFGSKFEVPSQPVTARPQDLLAYACLFKQLNFAHPFERIDDTLEFGGFPVRAFGLTTFKPGYERLYPQVLVHDYRDEHDFVIELKSTAKGERLILAKVSPEPSLAGTVARVMRRAADAKAPSAQRNDQLIIPRLGFDLTRRYSELEGGRLTTTNRSGATAPVLMSAVQNTRFEMNERGVELRSQSHLRFGCSSTRAPAPARRLIFDRPFLILLQRENASLPYFALWVDNAELLVSR